MDYLIAVVDDDAFSLKNAKSILNDQGMKVTCLRSGQALLEYMETHDPDLILLDILMPEMDGFETFQALRRQEESRRKTRTPVIFLTGENNGEVERRGLNAGASDFIHKPFDQEILVSRINNTIENSRMVESLTEDATMDKLTGFLNKNSGTAKISSLCGTEAGALLLLDLDSFKLVNDIFGHDMGDLVLEAFADIVRYNIRSDDIMSRIGGDEFMGFFCDLLSKQSVESLVKRLNDQMLKRCTQLMGENFGIPIGISAGVVFVPEHGTDYHTLFKLADNTLYDVKNNGRHGCGIYDPIAVRKNAEIDPKQEMARISQVMKERGNGRGAQLLGQDAFSDNYRYIERMMKLYGGRVTKILYTLKAANGRGRDISAEVRRFGEHLQISLRECDIIFQNRRDQFFAVLPQMPSEAETDAGEAVLESWKEKDENASVEVTCVRETVNY